MADGAWGVSEVVIKYHSKDGEWEVSIDPAKVDILVFNWERFKEINNIIGQPITKDHHLKADGGSDDGAFTPEQIAQQLGSNGPPRLVGPPPQGVAAEDSGDPICYHNRDCTWFCTDDTHIHH